LAKHFKDGDSISLIVIRNNSSLKLLGFVKGKPYEVSDKFKITYGEFKFNDELIRTILKNLYLKKVSVRFILFKEFRAIH
jgi:hypothetical protein